MAVADRQAERVNRPAPVWVIEPSRGVALNLREVWQYRDLFFVLVWRTFSANYRQSLIGLGWALIRPALTTLTFTLVFGRIARVSSDGIPYPLFAYTALVPWLFFTTSLAGSTTSVVSSGTLLTKVYFPRIILPLASVATAVIDLVIQLALLGVMLAWYRTVPSWTVVLLPAFLVATGVTALAAGLWLTALNVKYRDIGHAVPFLIQLWMWLSPIAYPSSMVPQGWRTVYALNPMAGLIEGIRWCVFRQTEPDWAVMAISLAVVLALFLSGLFYFRKVEATFADII